MKEPSSKLSEYEGVIIASEWDDEGDVTQLKLSATNEIEYEILLNSKGKHLLNHVKSFVRIYGSVKQSKFGNNLNVKEYKILNKIKGENND